ncbi:LysR family transcriptional regulator [Shewanella dokdonensis]|uniref:LysR family transcriptional regulator n=1 Tax=Shewanella dokdonensis TaxID=712036 RepID=A0ABX8DBJ6_9GAMM|nr:LysR family transcriptional regulator [Shewanella dokdonensis]MCL1075431.1 LysR family transcriptional regulator [Shewanella dokdonensis]QVK22121.1 LysR family transcriptional regulator [Shewanella dokdonensis]
MKATLDEMQVLLTVADSGTISAAAERLDQTVSATSRTLAKLENKLGTTLLNRTTRRLELTEEGAAYLTEVRQIVQAVEAAEEMLALRKGQPSGLLRVDAATPFMLHVITPLVKHYQQQYPQVVLELNSNEGITDLLERRTDVAFRIGQLKDSTLHARPIASSRIRILASPDYLASTGMPTQPSELQQHCLLGFTQPDSLNLWPLPGDDGQLLKIVPSIASSNGETLRQLALQGVGIVCLSDFMTRNDRQTGQLVELFEEQTLEIRQAINAVYYRNTALSTRISSFIDFLIAALGPRNFAD